MKSNQFPRQQDKDETPLSTTEKANFIWLNFEKKMPKLYKQIMEGKNERL